MARSRQFDDETVVRAARDLFWAHGYVGTSLAQLQRATGLSKSSLYEAYGSKWGLFRRAAQNYVQEGLVPMLAPLEAAGSGKPQLVGYFCSLADLVRSAPPEVAARGCFMVNTCMELDEVEADAFNLIQTYRGRLRSAFLNALGSIESVKHPEGTAAVLAAGQLGLMVTARLDPVEGAALADLIAAQIRGW